jgi:hypothetical protein
MDTPTFSDDRPFAAVESALEAEINNRAMHFTQVDSHAYYPLCLLPSSGFATRRFLAWRARRASRDS